MTQTALDSYALANGFGKTTSKMTEAEKVALRYKFVQDQLSFAIGDFADTSTGWANQVRILQLQFDSLKATIGQGLIAAFSPVIQVLNAIIGKLITAANAVKAFFNLLGGKTGGGSAKTLTAGTDAVAKSADNASSALGGTGSAAKKAANSVKTATTGLDELNIISPDTSSGSGSGSGSGGAGGGYAAEDFDFGTAEAGADAVSEKMQKIVDLLNDLKNSFTAGFWDALGDTSVFDSIQNNLDRIKTALTNIFTDSDVQAKAYECANTISYAFGQIAGSVVSIGASIADGLTGAIANYLEQNTPRIQGYIISMMDVAGQIASQAGDYAEACGVIFEVFRSDSAKQIGADLIGIFADAFMGVTELIGSFVADVYNVLVQPIIDNAELIKTTIEGTLSAIEPVFATLKGLVDELVDKAVSVYNEHISPLLDSLAQGFSEIATTLLEAYNTYILPVLEELGQRFPELQTALSPVIDKFMEFGGKCADAVKLLWENVVQPFIEWFIANVAPIISEQLQLAIDIFFTFYESISEVIEGALDILNGIIDFLVGVFTGDWEQAWTGVKEILSGIWEIIKGLVSLAVNAVRDVVIGAWNLIKTTTSTVWNGIKTLLSTLWNYIKSLATSLFTAIKDKLAEIWDTIKSKIETVWNAVKQFFSDVWNGIKDTVSGLVDAIHDKISSVMDTIKTGIQTALDTIKGKWEEIWGGLKTTTVQIFDDIWNGIKGAINSILSGVETMANGVVRGINKMIDALNNLSFDVPDWVPEIGGETFGLNIPNLSEISLPRLANGGYVQANTPQLAMIGDNRTQGEIVSPEDKLQEMAARAVEMAQQNGGAEYMQMAVELLQRIVSLIEGMNLAVNIDIREIKKQLTNLENRTGYTLRTT